MTGGGLSMGFHRRGPCSIPVSSMWEFAANDMTLKQFLLLILQPTVVSVIQQAPHTHSFVHSSSMLYL